MKIVGATPEQEMHIRDIEIKHELKLSMFFSYTLPTSIATVSAFA
jgi:hypothetical protein